jgi:hypothetical protein
LGHLHTAVPICPNGVTVQQNEPCPVPDQPPATDSLAQDSNSLPEAFYFALHTWISCEQPRAEEAARRVARAGPHRSADLSNLPDCEAYFAQLGKVVQTLEPGSMREAADRLVQSYLNSVYDSAKRVYGENNYE